MNLNHKFQQNQEWLKHLFKCYRIPAANHGRHTWPLLSQSWKRDNLREGTAPTLGEVYQRNHFHADILNKVKCEVGKGKPIMIFRFWVRHIKTNEILRLNSSNLRLLASCLAAKMTTTGRPFLSFPWRNTFSASSSFLTCTPSKFISYFDMHQVFTDVYNWWHYRRYNQFWPRYNKVLCQVISILHLLLWYVAKWYKRTPPFLMVNKHFDCLRHLPWSCPQESSQSCFICILQWEPVPWGHPLPSPLLTPCN